MVPPPPPYLAAVSYPAPAQYLAPAHYPAPAQYPAEPRTVRGAASRQSSVLQPGDVLDAGPANRPAAAPQLPQDGFGLMRVEYPPPSAQPQSTAWWDHAPRGALIRIQAFCRTRDLWQ